MDRGHFHNPFLIASVKHCVNHIPREGALSKPPKLTGVSRDGCFYRKMVREKQGDPTQKKRTKIEIHTEINQIHHLKPSFTPNTYLKIVTTIPTSVERLNHKIWWFQPTTWIITVMKCVGIAGETHVNFRYFAELSNIQVPTPVGFKPVEVYTPEN